jgi:hypothetical protein
MILRQYRSDQLPGLLYSIFPPRQTAPVVATDLSSIGQKNNKKKVTAAERIAVKTVKRAGIEGKETGEVDLVIEVLEISQEVTGSPATGECVVWSLTPTVKTIHSSANPSTASASEEREDHIQVPSPSPPPHSSLTPPLVPFLSSDHHKVFLASCSIFLQRKRRHAQLKSFEESFLSRTQHPQ